MAFQPLNLPYDRMEMRQDRRSRSDLQTVYQGFAPPGTPESAGAWTVYSYSHDSNGFITRRQTNYKFIWDNRTNITV